MDALQTLWWELKLLKEHIREQGEVDSEVHPVGKKGEAMKNQKILVVDDEWAVLELLRVRLTKQGYEVLTARSERQFWDLALNESPDLLILDIWLGNKIGTQSYEGLLQFGFDPQTPVIFITSLVEEGTKPKHAPAGGKFALFGKPFQFDDLMKEVKKLLNPRSSVSCHEKISA